MRIIPDSNGEDTTLQEFNACHSKRDGKFARKGEAGCAATDVAKGPGKPVPFQGSPNDRAIRAPMSDIGRGGPGMVPRKGARRGPMTDIGRGYGAKQLDLPMGDPGWIRDHGMIDPMKDSADEAWLRTAKVTYVEDFTGGISTTLRVTLRGQDGKERRAIFKPQELAGGEGDAEREQAGYLLSRMMGFENFSPAAIATDITMQGAERRLTPDSSGKHALTYSEQSFLDSHSSMHGVLELYAEGFMQQSDYAGEAWDAHPVSNYRELNAEEIWRFTTMDYLMANQDRHSNNYMREESSGRAIAIDHNLCWGSGDYFYSEPKRQFPHIGNTATRSAKLLKRLENVDWDTFKAKSGLDSGRLEHFTDRLGRLTEALRTDARSTGEHSTLLKLFGLGSGSDY